MILLGSCWMRRITGKATDGTEAPPMPCKSMLNGNISFAGSRTNRLNLWIDPLAQKTNLRSGISSRKICNCSTAKLVCSSFTAVSWATISAICDLPPVFTVKRSLFIMFCEWLRAVLRIFGILRPRGSVFFFDRTIKKTAYRINK